MIDNYVVETAEGYGMVIDSSSCKLELNQLKKNSFGGLLIKSSPHTISHHGVNNNGKNMNRKRQSTRG